MKHFVKQNAGLTLIELVVAMAIATVVTAAAASVLFFGLRINRQTGDTASQQITVRSLLDVMENIASSGNIKEVVSNIPAGEGEPEEYGSWMLIGKDDRIVFRYDAREQTIYTNDVPVLGGVYASNAIMEGQLLSISVETKEGIYTSSIYCRTAEPEDDAQIPDFGTGSDFIEILKSQYRSQGTIWKKVPAGTDENGEPIYKYVDSGEYYSEWYIERDYDDNIPDNGWNANTPWCACYVSWALVQANVNSPVAEHPKWFANVDDFMDYFRKNGYNDDGQSWLDGGSKPDAGDLIFFDWNKGDNPQHMGVVLNVSDDGKWVYTIEGNSAGRVTIRSYSMTDARIIGYGILFGT